MQHRAVDFTKPYEKVAHDELNDFVKVDLVTLFDLILIPKLLVHRMFPNGHFSLWIDGKLELVVDPYQILERFLWRKNANSSISRPYEHFDVFLEAEANKAAAKYDNASIDFQVDFYKKEGLTPYSEAKLPITSGRWNFFPL